MVYLFLLLTKKIPIIKIYSKFRGNNSFRIHRINDLLVDEAPYDKFQSEFNKFSETDKDKFRNIGKEIINKRLSGDYDDNLPYIKLVNIIRTLIQLLNLILIKRKCFY